jgi:3-methyladenine DNA glycosylase AlkD
MARIKKVIATEELLKIYFFKLYSRKNQIPIIFNEEIGDLICSKTFEEFTSKELFSYCFAGLDNEPMYNEINKMPKSFYYFDDNLVTYENIESYPFLYTDIKTVENSQILEASVHELLSDFYDKKGKYLDFSYTPDFYELYTEGVFCFKKFINKEYFVINSGIRGEYWSYYLSIRKYLEGKFEEAQEIDSIELLELIEKKSIRWRLRDLSSELKINKNVLLKAVFNNASVLSEFDESLKKDKQFILEAVKNDGRAFEYVELPLRNDREIILEAVRNDVNMFKYVDKSMKNDWELVLLFFKKKLDDIKSYEYSYRTNREGDEVSGELNNKSIFRYDEMKNDIQNELNDLLRYLTDEEFCTRVFGLPILTEELKDNDYFVLKLYEIWPHYLGEFIDYNIFYIIASPRLMLSKEFMIRIFKCNTWEVNLEWHWGKFSKSFWTDKEFVQLSVNQSVSSFEFASYELKRDREFILEIVKSNGLVLKYVDDSLKSDKEIIFESIKQDVNAYQYVDKELQNDFEVKQYYKKRLIEEENFPF